MKNDDNTNTVTLPPCAIDNIIKTGDIKGYIPAVLNNYNHSEITDKAPTLTRTGGGAVGILPAQCFCLRR